MKRRWRFDKDTRRSNYGAQGYIIARTDFEKLVCPTVLDARYQWRGAYRKPDGAEFSEWFSTKDRAKAWVVTNSPEAVIMLRKTNGEWLWMLALCHPASTLQKPVEGSRAFRTRGEAEADARKIAANCGIPLQV